MVGRFVQLISKCDSFNNLVDQMETRPCPFARSRWTKQQHLSFPSFLAFPFLSCSRSYQPHFEEWEPIWGDDWLHSPFIRWSPSWDFRGFSLAVRQMPGDICTVSGCISLSPLSLATNMTLGANGLWLGTQTGVGGTTTQQVN